MSTVLRWVEALVLSAVAVFAPIEGVIVTTAVMIAADLVTGVVAAHKRGEPITSAGLRRSLTKLGVYESAVMLAYLGEHYMSDALPLVKLAAGMVSLVELKSIYENLNAISGTELLKSLIDKLGSANQDKS